MKKQFILLGVLFIISSNIIAQTDTIEGIFWGPKIRNYEVKHAFEVESLFPMFFTGGYHFAVGYRYKKFRLRVSVINGGNYNAETAGVNNNSDNFKRYYQTSPGVFLGYNLWKNLELYTYVESHTFVIEQKSTGIKHDLKSKDFGAGLSYQFFIGRYIYIQPGLHLYLRATNSSDFNGIIYHIPNADISPVIRFGVRLWGIY